MAEMLLINPRRRAKAKARRASPKRRRRNPVRVVARTPAPIRRRRNPVAALSRIRRRRRNPVAALSRMRRRRRNPIGIGGVSVNSFVAMLKDAAVGGAGAIGADMLMGYANRYLPAMLQSAPGTVNVGTAVKALLTAVAGQLLSKPTRGLSRKMATGALAVQARDALVTFLPMGGMTMGYASPATITQGSNRVGPIRPGMNAYVRGGSRSPLLNAYTQPGVTPLLSARPRSAREREGVSVR